MLKKFDKWVKTTPPSQILALILSGPAITALIIYMISAVIFAAWNGVQASLQLQIIREAVAYSFILLLVIIGALTAGLVRGFKIGMGKVTAEVDLQDEDDDEEVKAKVIEAERSRERELSMYSGSSGYRPVDDTKIEGEEIISDPPEGNDMIEASPAPKTWDDIKNG